MKEPVNRYSVCVRNYSFPACVSNYPIIAYYVSAYTLPLPCQWFFRQSQSFCRALPLWLLQKISVVFS